MTDRVLFISVFYNRAYCIDESVPTMVNQTYKNITILLWDDASTDDTYEKLVKYKSNNVIVKRSTNNQGLTKSLIQAISETDSEYIAIHGSGDISHPERIEKQVIFLRNNQNCGVCACATIRRSEAFGTRFSGANKATGFEDPMQPPLVHGEVMYRRSIYNEVGGYRSFFEMSQDYDLWLRFREFGTQFGVHKDELYSTVSRRDGVSGDCVKKYIQSCYAGIAYQTHLDRMRGKVDTVELYGKHAFFLFKPNKLYASRMARVCILAVFNGNIEFAKRAANESLKGKIIPKVLLAWVLLFLSESIGMRVIRALFNLRLSDAKQN